MCSLIGFCGRRRGWRAPSPPGHRIHASICRRNPLATIPVIDEYKTSMAMESVNACDLSHQQLGLAVGSSLELPGAMKKEQ
jgi:hypothetical protein